MNEVLSVDGELARIHVPLTFRKRGGPKLVIAPDQDVSPLHPRSGRDTRRTRVDDTMVKALARAHRWKRLLDDGEYATAAEIADAEKLNRSYLCRVLRLTLLAPDITEMILNGRQPAVVDMKVLLKPFPLAWPEQRKVFGVAPTE